MIAKAEANPVQAQATASRVTTSATDARGMKIVGTGAAIGVGLWFMREALVRLKRLFANGENYTSQIARRN